MLTSADDSLRLPAVLMTGNSGVSAGLAAEVISEFTELGGWNASR